MNSEGPVSSVTAYAKAVKTDWPMYADVSRSFESSTLKKVISNSNIHQAMMMTPAGALQHINDADDAMEAAVRKELPNAKWKIDPKEVPAVLKKGWLALEFGQMLPAITAIKQALGAGDKDVKAAAAKLDAIVKEDVARRFADAQAKVAAGQKWDGYKEYEHIVLTYPPYAEAPKAKTEIGKLESDAKVKKEKVARSMLDKIQQWATSRVKAEHENAKMGLQMLQKDYADTEAGELSKSVNVPEKDEKKAG